MSGKNAQESRTRETHGMRLDINDYTPTSDVKAPNMFERVKEEIEAIVETIHPHNEKMGHVSPLSESERSDEDTNAGSKLEKHNFPSQEKDAEANNLIERAKEGIEAIIHKAKSSHHHHRETHGRSNDIDENTPITEIKGPNVFERAKEEIEALVDSFHHKDESKKKVDSPKKEEGCFGISVGKGLEKVCSPFGHKKD